MTEVLIRQTTTMSNNAIRVSTAELAAGLQEAVKIKTAEAVAQIQTELTSLQRKVEELEEENKRLKQHIIHNYQDLHPNGDGIPHTEFFPGGRYAVEDDGTRTPYSALCGQIGEGIDELNQKATAWKIINRADWGYLRELCDKEMCKDLIECGECNEEDFEGYDIYEEEEE